MISWKKIHSVQLLIVVLSNLELADWALADLAFASGSNAANLSALTKQTQTPSLHFTGVTDVSG